MGQGSVRGNYKTGRREGMVITNLINLIPLYFHHVVRHLVKMADSYGARFCKRELQCRKERGKDDN